MIGRDVNFGSSQTGKQTVTSNRLQRKQLLPWTDDGIPVKLFLEKYGSTIRNNTRLFYVISPNGQPGLYKIGIAGDSTGKPYSRLMEYYYFYGLESLDNKCTGARIHFCHTTAYIENTEKSNSEVWKLEKKIKDSLSKKAIRGDEWLETNLERIKKEYYKAIGNIKEIETIPRRSFRLRK